MVNEQVTTIELTAGTPSTVEFSGAYPYYWIDNKSDSDVYASLGTPEAGADGTYTIAAGSQLRISGGAFNTKLSLLGSGKVQVIASGIASCPFNVAQGGGDNVTVDVLNSALGGKADKIHTHTKSEITDFPMSLPASDVKDWAKANEKPTYTASEVGADVSGSADAALTNAKSYTDTKIADLINGAPTTLDTLGEIAEAMGNNKSVVEALNSAIGSKANATDLTAHIGNTSNPHNVTKSQIGLGNVPNVATNDQTPTYTTASSLKALSSGEKISIAFGKIAKAIADLISHIGNTVSHITSTERTNWNAAKSHADSAHAPSNAQVNVIETVKVNGTALTPSSKAVDITVPSYSAMTGATSSSAGTSGLVPAPASGNEEKFLKGDGTWDIPKFTGTLDDIPDGKNYYKSPYYIQAGSVTETGSSVSVTFPKEYAEEPLIFVVYTSTETSNATPTVVSRSTTGFTVKKGSTAGYAGFNWVAFGKLA